jgi:fibronectin-binding autotransporter adhesin
MRIYPASGFPRFLSKRDVWKNLLALLILAGAAGAVSLHAQFTWTDASGTNNNLSNPLNWLEGLPSLNSNIAFGPASLPAAVNLDVPFTVNSVTFSGPTAFGINGSSALTFTGGVTSGITNNTSGGTSIFVNVPVILGGPVTVTNTAGATAGLLMAGNLSGAGNLTIVNNGTQPLQFSGVDTRTSGSTTISAGTFTVGNGISTTAMIAGNVSNSGALSFFTGAGAALTYAGAISGTGSVSLGGSNTATLTLTGANTYSGLTSVTNGTLADGVSGASFSSNSSVLVGTSGTLSVNSNETIAGLQNGGGGGTVSLASGTALTVNTTGIAGPFSGVINGSGALVTGGTGTMTLNGISNSYSGGTTVSSGTLVVNNASGSATGSGGVTISNGATLQIGAVGVGTNGAIAGSVTDNGTLSFAETNTFGNTITGTGVLTVLNGGNATITGNSNTYSGGTTINNGGTLIATNASGSATGSGSIVINNGGTLKIGNGSAGAVSGSITDNGSLTFNLGSNSSFGNAVSGTGGLTQNGSTTLTLTGTNKTYSGTTTINSGTITDGAAAAFSSSSVVALNGGSLNVNFTDTIAGLSGSGGTVNLGSGTTLTISGTFPQSYGGTIAGLGGLTKSGVGGQTLSGANTYSGGTLISSGTLFATNSSGSATGTGSITISGGTLNIGNGGATGAVSGNVIDNGNLTFNLTSNLSFANGITGTGGLQQSGTTTLTLGGTNTYSGTTTINTAGTIADGAAGAFSPNSGVALNVSGATLTVNNNETINGLSGFSGSVVNVVNGGTTLTISSNATPGPFGGIITGAGAILKAGTGSETFSAGSTYSGGTTINGGIIFATNASGSATGTGSVTIGSGATLQIGQGGGGATGAVSGAIIDNGTLNFNLTVNNSFGNGITGTGGLLQLGTTVLTLSGVNTFSGNTTINAGTIADAATGVFSPNSEMFLQPGGNLQVNFNETIGGLQGNTGSPSNVVIAAGKTLTTSSTVNHFFPGIISGAGSFIVGGTSIETLIGASTYTGGTTINSGATLQLGSTTTPIGTLVGSIVDNGTLILKQVGGSVTYSNPTSGTGALVVDGNTSSGADMTFPNANTYSGGTTIIEGNVFLTNTSGSALGTGAINLTSHSPTSIGSGGGLIGNASVAGPITVGGGGKIFAGSNPGSAFVPGILSAPGLTLAGNGVLFFFTNNATGVAGTNWGLLNISGALNITANGTTPFDISANSVNVSNLAGTVVNFNPAQSYSWMIVSTTGGITGFASNAFIISSTATGSLPGFQNSLGTGSFFVSQVGNNLFLNFTPVPEPSTWGLLLAGTTLLAMGAMRRRRKIASSGR